MTGDADTPGARSAASPSKASTKPNHWANVWRSPRTRPVITIVAWTAPKRRSAPAPAGSEMYAKENAEAYANSATAALHEPRTWATSFDYQPYDPEHDRTGREPYESESRGINRCTCKGQPAQHGICRKCHHGDRCQCNRPRCG